MDHMIATAVARHWESALHLPSQDALKSVLGAKGNYAPGTPLPAGHAETPKLILSGWAISTFMLAHGKRQILDFHLPGELLLCGESHEAMECVALTAVTLVATHGLAAEALARLVRQQEKERVLRLTMRLASMGQQRAQARTAALLLDLYQRLDRVGLAEEGHQKVPVTQNVLADALGLSAVHVNRVLHRLRQDRIILVGNHGIEILDPGKLAAAAI